MSAKAYSGDGGRRAREIALALKVASSALAPVAHDNGMAETSSYRAIVLA